MASAALGKMAIAVDLMVDLEINCPAVRYATACGRRES